MDTYEKKYKDLLKRLENAKEDNNVNDERYCCVIDEIVPELTESEDGIIRKEIIEYLKDEMAAFPSESNDFQKWIVWLEKQSKQKPVYVVTRSEEHSDYVEAVFLNEDKAEEYCKVYNEDANSYHRNITKIKIQ